MTEPRVKAITKLYYSNPKIQQVIFTFSQDREVVPRYYEGFGKRPDTLLYPADIMGLVNKGATSFHASEEIWQDPLKISSDMDQEQLSEIRKGWDLLIDIDSPYLDYSKIAAKLIIKCLEAHGIKSYGVKFSGSKGFHIIVPWKSFPERFKDLETAKMFPEWPRAISEYLMLQIRPEYNKIVTSLGLNFEALQKRTNLSKEDVTEIKCPNCGADAKKGNLVVLECNACKTRVDRKNYKITKRRLFCINDSCPGVMEVKEEKDYFRCDNCGTDSFDKRYESSNKVVYSDTGSFSTEFKEEISGEKMASLDLVLVASRHLFRAPYSLHEKTALASTVILKDEIDAFQPKDASPLNVKIRQFYPDVNSEEASNLLEKALEWKAKNTKEPERKKVDYAEIELKNVPEEAFPQSIKKLLKGLKDGKKRGLFILITFLRCLNFPDEYIEGKIYDWNKKNSPPLKQGYVKSQLDWHFRQKKKILPPNYSNQSFYKDLNLLDKDPGVKNPIVEVMRAMKKQ